jgi:hypothetical protein
MAQCSYSSSRGSRALLGRASQPSRTPCQWLHRHGYARIPPCLRSSLPNRFEQQLPEQQGSSSNANSGLQQQQRVRQEDERWPEPVPYENGNTLDPESSNGVSSSPLYLLWNCYCSSIRCTQRHALQCYGIIRLIKDCTTPACKYHAATCSVLFWHACTTMQMVQVVLLVVLSSELAQR